MAGWRYSRENREWGGEREGKPESYSRDTRGGGGGGMHLLGGCTGGEWGHAPGWEDSEVLWV